MTLSNRDIESICIREFNNTYVERITRKNIASITNVVTHTIKTEVKDRLVQALIELKDGFKVWIEYSDYQGRYCLIED